MTKSEAEKQLERVANLTIYGAMCLCVALAFLTWWQVGFLAGVAALFGSLGLVFAAGVLAGIYGIHAAIKQAKQAEETTPQAKG